MCIRDRVNNAVSSFKTFVKENQALVQIVGMGLIAIGGIGVALLGIGGSLYAAGLAFGALATAIGVIFSPLGLAIGGVAALGFALVKYSDIGSQAIEALIPVSYTHLRAQENKAKIVCRLLLEKQKQSKDNSKQYD